MTKLDLKYLEKVKIKNTGSELDGTVVYVVGVASRHVLDTYILEFLEEATRTAPDGNEYSSFVMWEACLERV